MSGLSMDAFNASHFLFDDQSDNTRYRILFVSHHDNAWLSALLETNYQVDTVDNIATAVLKLNDNVYHLVALDDESLGKDIYQTVPEFKRLKPLIPILVITGMESLIHHAELM